MYGAGAADRRLASDVCTRETPHVSQIVDEQEPGLDFALLGHAVDADVDSLLHKSHLAWFNGELWNCSQNRACLLYNKKRKCEMRNGKMRSSMRKLEGRN